MPYTLPALPYEPTAFGKVVSAETFEYHHGKHHKTYVDTLNKLVEGKPEATKTLDELVVTAPEGPLFNNAAQHWNHSFFWKCIKPGGGLEPTGELMDAVKRDFGSFDELKKQFTDAALTQFGSGWAWIVKDGGKLKVVKTSNADLPLKRRQTPILTVDVWEHAYYIDYRNARAKWVEAFLNNLANWDFAAANFKK